MTTGDTQSYLGMQITLQDHAVHIDMSFFIKAMLDEFKTKKRKIIIILNIVRARQQKLLYEQSSVYPVES